MQCFKCIEHMTSGNLPQLKECRSQCELYQNNQCHHMSVEGSFNGKIQDANVSFFPERIKEIMVSPILPILAIFLTISLAVIMLGSPIGALVNADVTSAVEKAIEPSAYVQLIRSANALDDNVEAFKLVSTVYVSNQGAFTSREIDEMRQYLLNLGNDASLMKPSKVYEIVGVDESSPPRIFKIHGYVSRTIYDVYSGNIAIVSDTTVFNANSLQVHVADSSSLYEGAEVIFLCVPEFVNIATPLTVYGWVQP